MITEKLMLSTSDAYPIPRNDDPIDELGQATTLDLTQGIGRGALPQNSLYYSVWPVPVQEDAFWVKGTPATFSV